MGINNIISFWGIGSGGDPAVRCTQFLTPKTGWPGFIGGRDFQKQLEAGCRRFLLWMPFGCDPSRKQIVDGVAYDSALRFDQYLLAKKNGPEWITAKFAETIRPLTEQGIQVIAYMGTLPGAPEYEWWRDAGMVNRLKQEQWVWECLEPFLEADCDLAFDSAVLAKPWHYLSRIVAQLRTEKPQTKIYAEAMPYAMAPHWAAGDILSSDEQYQAAINPGNKATFVPVSDIKGELVRGFWSSLPKQYKTARDWYRAVVPGCIKDGHTACIQLRYHLAAGGTLEELL